MQWQNQQGDINKQRRREGLEIPDGEAIDNNSNDAEQDGDTPNRVDTWYDRAVEWF